jgi:hypothetical protein
MNTYIVLALFLMRLLIPIATLIGVGSLLGRTATRKP